MKPYGLIKRTFARCRTYKILGRPIKIIIAPPKNRKAERQQLISTASE